MGYPQSIYLHLEQKNIKRTAGSEVSTNQKKVLLGTTGHVGYSLENLTARKPEKKPPSKRKRYLQKPSIFRFHVSVFFFNHEISLGFPHQLPPQISEFLRFPPWPWRTTEKHGTVGRPGVARQSRLRAARKRGMSGGHALFSKNRSYHLVCVYLYILYIDI